jgi:hypothetical protein
MRFSMFRLLTVALGSALLALTAPAAQAWNGYDFTDLGPDLKPKAVNASEQIVGERLNYPHNGENFYLDDGVPINLQNPAGVGTGAGNDINDAGKIIGGGQAVPDLSFAHPLMWPWGQTSPIDLGLGGTWLSATAFAINNAGHSVGLAELPYSYPNTSTDMQRAWISSGGSPTLFADNGTRRLGVGISDTGKVLVLSDYTDYLIADSGGGTTDTGLNYLGGYYHTMAEDGTIVGRMADQRAGVRDPTSGLVAALSDDTSYLPMAVNAGTVVGSKSTLAGSCAFAIVDGDEIDLEEALSAGWHTTAATDVNTKGDIVGTAVYEADGTTHGFLLSHKDGLSVKIDATSLAGAPITDGGVTTLDTFNVRVTVKNESVEDIDELAFTGGHPLTVDPRSPGGLKIYRSPADETLPATLHGGDERTFDYVVGATKSGLAAIYSRAGGKDVEDNEVKDHESVKLAITGAKSLEAALKGYVRAKALDRLLVGLARKAYSGWDKRAAQLETALRKKFSAAEEKKWFGSTRQSVVNNFQRAIGDLTARSSEAVATQLPNKNFKGYTVKELNDAYDQGFRDALGKRASKYAEKWSSLGSAAKTQVRTAYRESALAVNYMIGTASQDQREEIAVMLDTYSDGVVRDTESFTAWTKNQIDNAVINGEAMLDAFDNTEQGINDAMEVAYAPYDADQKKRAQLAKLADMQPKLYQRELGKLDGDIMGVGGEAIADTLIGGAATKVIASGGKAVKFVKKGAALMNFAKATEVIDESGKLSKGVHALKDTKQALDIGVSGGDTAALLADELALKNTAGATVVQASDYGNVYKLPNVGGVPEVTLDSKAGILAGIENDFAASYPGRSIELAEILKPSTELRKPGAVAKLELTGQKTGKAAMIDAGMPADALGEAVLWKPKVKPQKIPGFSKLSAERQAAALKEYESALKLAKEWKAPAAGSKTAKLKTLIGKEGTVPLDDEPWPGGLQRFVTGEFELVKVPGKYADAYLIRVKKYELVVKDMSRGGKVVNTKTVVNVGKAGKAVAQGVDADAVGLAKVVGRNADGTPILVPMTREEQDFVMKRYIDRNIKARASGLQKDIAEHGATWMMDDADAAHAGFLLPKFGVPFMPEDVARKFLVRIAKFVTPEGMTTGEMVAKMLDVVQSEGGFGQRAVVLTRDTRYLGEVPVISW